MKKDRRQIRLKRKTKTKSKNYVYLNPIMPRGYSSTQREQLRKFETEILGDSKKITLKLELWGKKEKENSTSKCNSLLVLWNLYLHRLYMEGDSPICRK